MNAKILSTIVAGLTFGVGPAANATDWADFSQFNTRVFLASASVEDMTVLRTVTVVCPLNGYLIAQAESQFLLAGDDSAPISFWVAYGLTLDSVAPIEFDSAHSHILYAFDPDGSTYRPGGIQRIVSCTAGQSVTVNFVAYRGQAGASTYAFQPKLSVDFFDKRI